MRNEIKNLLSFFIPVEAPRRSTSTDDALEIYSATQQVDSAYERFRNLLDPGDEDVLRRKAIGRFINLRWDLAKEGEKFAVALLRDLARGHYIPATTSRSLAVDISIVLQKTVRFVEMNNNIAPKWLMPMAAVEIDRIIYPREADDALVYFFYEEVKNNVIWKDDSISKEDKETQVFLACHRVLAKTDEAELFWHLYRTAQSAWTKNDVTDDELAEIVRNFPVFQKEIEEALYTQASVRVIRRLNAPAVPFRILRDVLRQPNAAAILANKDLLVTSTRDVLAKRIKKTEQQMLKRVWHAAAFLFLTKGILAMLTEVPYELFLGDLRYLPLMINLLFPPTLLFLMAGSVSRPGEKNAEQIVRSIHDIVYNGDSIKEIRVPSVEGRSFRKSVFATIYSLTALISLLVIIYVLNRLNFSLLGGFYFLIFLGLVSFLGLRLRYTMSECRIETKKTGIFSFFFDFLSVPIIDMGREISIRATQINVFLFIMDAVIEAPFKLILSLIEEWFSFVRERKEDLV